MQYKQLAKRKFIEASIARQEVEIARREAEAVQREVDRTRREQVRKRMFAASVAATVVLLIVAGVAVWQWRAASLAWDL